MQDCLFYYKLRGNKYKGDNYMFDTVWRETRLDHALLTCSKHVVTTGAKYCIEQCMSILYKTIVSKFGPRRKSWPKHNQIMANQKRGSPEGWTVKAYSVPIQPARLKKPTVHVYEKATKYRDTSKFECDAPQCHLRKIQQANRCVYCALKENCGCQSLLL